MTEGVGIYESIKKRYEPWVSENCRLAEFWRPYPIDWAVLAESPPYPRNEHQWLCPSYIYRVREGERGGHLLGAIVSGFLDEDTSEWRHAKRLRGLRRAQAFVLDVCEHPVNHLPHGMRTDEVKTSMGSSFKRRLETAQPNNIIVLGSQDPGEFGDIVRTNLEPRYRTLVSNDSTIPFPHGGGDNYARCRDGIKRCVDKIRKEKGKPDVTCDEFLCI